MRHPNAVHQIEARPLSKCPWAEEIVGAVALLKFHTENGEPAKLWSTDFENHFGFRLRTRDHDWITGKIFISYSEQAQDDKELLEFTTFQKSRFNSSDRSFSTSKVKIGKMFLACWTSKE